MEYGTTDDTTGDQTTRLTRHRPSRRGVTMAPVEVDQLVRAFLDAGGQVKVCPPGDALATAGNALQDRLRRAERLLGDGLRGEQRSADSRGA